MCAREETNLYRDLANLISLTAVEADSFLHREAACCLLMHPAEEVLADARLATCRLEDHLWLALAATCSADRIGNPLLERREATWEFVGEDQQELCCCFSVSSGSMVRGCRCAIDACEVSELERLALWVRLLEEDVGVEVAPLLGCEGAPLAECLVKEGDVKAKVVPDKDCALGEFSNLLGCCLRRQSALNVLVGDAVHLGADDAVTGVNKAAPAVGDLATLDLDCSDFHKIRNLRIKAGRLRVNDDEGAAVCGCLSKRQHAVGAWLDVWNALLLADLGAQLLL